MDSTELPVICCRRSSITSGRSRRVVSPTSFGSSASATAAWPFSRTSCCMPFRPATASAESPGDFVSASTIAWKYRGAWRNIANAA